MKPVLAILGLILLTPPDALAETAIYEFTKGDDVGKVLDKLGSCPLWGKSNNVEQFFKLNPGIKNKGPRRIRIGTKVIVPLPKQYSMFAQNYIVTEDNVVEMLRGDIGSNCTKHTPIPQTIAKTVIPYKSPKEEKQKKPDNEVVAIEEEKTITKIGRWLSSGFMKRNYNIFVMPGYVGNNQTLKSSGEDFNSSFYVFNKIGASVEFLPSDDTSYEFSLFYQSAAINSTSAGRYNVKASETSFLSPSFTLKHCVYETAKGDKICPMLKVGVDSAFILEFADNTNLELAHLEDIYTGIGVSWIHQYNATGTTGYLNFNYDKGEERGKNIDITWKNNSRWSVSSYLEFPLQKWSAQAFTGAQLKKHTFGYVQDSDQWNIEATSVEFIGGLRF